MVKSLKCCLMVVQTVSNVAILHVSLGILDSVETKAPRCLYKENNPL